MSGREKKEETRLKFSKIVVGILCLAMLTGCGNGTGTTSQEQTTQDAAKNKEVTILYTNDIHTYINNTVTDEEENEERGLSYASVAAMKKDMETRFTEFVDKKTMRIQVAYTYDRAVAEEFAKEVQAAFPEHEIVIEPLSLSVACHIGPGSLALACANSLEDEK